MMMTEATAMITMMVFDDGKMTMIMNKSYWCTVTPNKDCKRSDHQVKKKKKLMKNASILVLASK
jgi:hypothetical protein